MSKPTFLLFPFGLTDADARIGRLVTNPFEPQASYRPEQPSVPEGRLSKKDQVAAKALLDSVQELNIKTSLTNLFQLNYSKSKQAQATLETSYIHTTLLRNSEDELSGLLKDESTREWINRNGGQKLYLITGIKVFEDAKVSVEHTSGSATQVTGTVPVTAALTQGAAPVAGVDNLDMKFCATANRKGTMHTTFEGVGATTFAVEYRELKYKNRFGKKNLDRARLAYAAAPAGGQAIFYAGEPMANSFKSNSGDRGDTTEDVLELELGYEDFSPMTEDGDFDVEESEELLFLKKTEGQ